TLAAGVAHELNNPLAAISAFAQSLDNASMPPDEAEALDAIIEESRRAKGIVQNILGFARRRKPDRRPVDLAEVVERILTLRKHEHRKNDVHVSVDFAPECPLAVADENELQQVLLNLIVNAAHALLEKSSGSREIVIRGRGDARKGITITIEDNGVGIPSDVLPKLFDPFFTTKPEGLGTGLGLSISYGIVAEHGGRIWAENREEGGARFIVELLSVAGRGVPTAERSTEALVVDVGRQRVLVADDDSGNRRALSRVLKKLGHDVEAAHDGTSAFELIMANSFDVVISDLHMPGLSGKELFEAVLRDRPQMARRFVFMSGDTVSHDARSFLESTGQPSLQKPYELDELQLLVARIIAGSSRARPSMTSGAMLPPG
ncbi:MAG: ATP-binding protein, partial [Gemmatimonadales bacterium]